jgi:uncharacterized OsmC-like protein
MRVDVAWKGELAFEATPPTGFRFTMDGHPESGGQGLGPTPMEALLAAAAACSAMDVVSILEKKRQNVTAYRIEIEGERPPEGEWPRPFTRLTVRRHEVLLRSRDAARRARRHVVLADRGLAYGRSKIRMPKRSRMKKPLAIVLMKSRFGLPVFGTNTMSPG